MAPTAIQPYYREISGLGFAGDLETAIELFTVLRRDAREAKHPLTYDHILLRIQAAELKAQQINCSLAIVGWYRFDDGKCSSLSVKAQHLETEFGGHMLIAGSGAETFLKAFHEVVQQSDDFTPQLGNHDDRMHWAFLQAALVGNEGMLGPDARSLKELFGGGYELVALHKNGFEKAAGITTVLWEANFEFSPDQRAEFHEFLAFKSAYVGDALVIRVCSAHGTTADGVEFQARDKTYVALPPYEDPQQPFPDEERAVDLPSQVVCHVVFVNVDNRLHSFFLDIDIGPLSGLSHPVAFSRKPPDSKVPFSCTVSPIRHQEFLAHIHRIALSTRRSN